MVVLKKRFDDAHMACTKLQPRAVEGKPSTQCEHHGTCDRSCKEGACIASLLRKAEVLLVLHCRRRIEGELLDTSKLPPKRQHTRGPAKLSRIQGG